MDIDKDEINRRDRAAAAAEELSDSEFADLVQAEVERRASNSEAVQSNAQARRRADQAKSMLEKML